MPFPKWMRGESDMQFVETARLLEELITDFCTDLPTKYTKYWTDEIVKLAAEVHNYTRAANNIFPQNKHELQMRRDYLTRANAALQNIGPKLGIIYDKLTKHYKSKYLENPNTRDPQKFKKKSDWLDGKVHQAGEYIFEESKLISKVKSADLDRFKSLPD